MVITERRENPYKTRWESQGAGEEGEDNSDLKLHCGVWKVEVFESADFGWFEITCMTAIKFLDEDVLSRGMRRSLYRQNSRVNSLSFLHSV